MKFNKWTLGLAAVGVVSLTSAARADEKMSQLQTALSNTTISGYVDVSAQYNLGKQNGVYGAIGNTPPYAYGGINKADGFNLNAIDIAIDRPEDETPWAAGYHIEIMGGPDVPTRFYPGTIGPVNTTPILNQIYSPYVNIRQAYITLRTPVGNSGIDWKVGVWDTIIGYESTSDPLNPNFTRSYGYSIEPTTHTGILGTYKLNDQISISGGVADSSNVGTLVQPVNGRSIYESDKTYMGALALTAPDSWGWAKGATLNGGVIQSLDSKLGGGGLPNTFGTTSYYIGATVPTPWTPLKVGVCYDYLALHQNGGEAWVVGTYANWQATDKLSLNVRGEYAQDDTGTLFGGAGARQTGEEFTATVQYNLWANVLSRVEFRWDHVEHGNAYDAAHTASFTPDKANAYLLALNLIYQF